MPQSLEDVSKTSIGEGSSAVDELSKGNKGKHRKKSTPFTSTESTETAGSVSASSSTISISATNNENALNDINTLQHAHDSTVSLPSFPNNQLSSTPEDSSPLPISTPTTSVRGKKTIEGAFRALQSIISPTYSDHEAEFYRLFNSYAMSGPLDKLLYVTAGAVNKDLLYSGKIYISQNYICFYSGVFKSLTIVIPFKHVDKIRKERVLRMMNTAIEVVKKDGEKVAFIHVSNRDLLFQEMFELWQNAKAGKVLTTAQVDSKLKQFYGSLPTSSPPTAANPVDIRWRNEDESVDFIASRDDPESKDDMETPTEICPTVTNDNEKPDDTNPLDSPFVSANQFAVEGQSGTLKISSPSTNTGNCDEVANGDEKPESSPEATHLAPRSRRKLLHSESVKDESEEGVDKKVTRCRSRSASGSREVFTSAGITDGHKPTPTPTPSPSPPVSSTATTSTAELVRQVQSIFFISATYPSANFAPCNEHSHLKKTIMDEEIALPPEYLAGLIFGPSKAYDRLMKRYGGSNIEFPPWEPAIPSADVEAMQKGEIPATTGITSVRNGTYSLQLGWAVGPRSANLVEKHTMFPETIPGVFHVIERETMAPGMPYGNDFYTVWRYCIRRLPSKSADDKIVHSWVKLTGEVRYRKHIWKAFQSMIERNAQTGVETFLTQLRAILPEECKKYAEEANAKDKSPSAGVNLSVTPSTDPNPPGNTNTTRSISTQTLSDRGTILSEKPENPAGFEATSLFPRIDQMLSGNPMLAVRVILTAAFILLIFNFFLASRVSDIEDILLRRGLPPLVSPYTHFNHGNSGQHPNGGAFQHQPELSRPEIRQVLAQLSQVAGQLSDSLGLLAESIRNQNLASGEKSEPPSELGS